VQISTSVQSATEGVTLKPYAATVKGALCVPVNQDTPETDFRVQVLQSATHVGCSCTSSSRVCTIVVRSATSHSPYNARSSARSATTSIVMPHMEINSNKSQPGLARSARWLPPCRWDVMKENSPDISSLWHLSHVSKHSRSSSPLWVCWLMQLRTSTLLTGRARNEKCEAQVPCNKHIETCLVSFGGRPLFCCV